MNELEIFWYILTCYFPRKLPASELEYDFFMEVMTQAYQVPDSPQARATIAAQVGAVPGYRIRKAWGHIANTAKRLTVNKIAQEYKIRAMGDLQKELEKAIQENVEQGGALEKEVEDQKEFISEA